MKRQLFFYGFLFVFFNNTFGQSVFHKQYLQPCYWSQLLQTDAAGSIYIGGVDVALRFFIVKLDSIGNVIWDYSIGSPNRRHLLKDMIMLPSQKLIMVGSRDEGVFSPWGQTVIICIDTSGAICYTKTIGDSISQNNYPINCIPDSLGYTISIDSRPPSRWKLIRFDELGNNLRETLTEYIDGKILKLYDGSYLSYQYYGFNLGHVDSNFLNASGEYSNSTVAMFTDVNIEKIVYSSDSGLYAIGITGAIYNGAFIAKLTSAYHIEWMKTYSFDPAFGCSANFWDMKELEDKTWMAYGGNWGSLTDCSDGYPAFVMHLDSNFNPIKTTLIGSPDFFEFLNTKECVLQNGAFLFTTASPYDSTTTISAGFHVIKTDSSLSGICEAIDTSLFVFFDDQMYSSSVSFNSTVHSTIPDTIVFGITNFFPAFGFCSDSTVSISQSEIKIPPCEIVISPNPASFQFEVNSSAFGVNSHLEIFNLLGEKIYSAVFCRPMTVVPIPIAIGTIGSRPFPRGIYFVSVSDGEKQMIQKLVVEAP